MVVEILLETRKHTLFSFTIITTTIYQTEFATFFLREEEVLEREREPVQQDVEMIISRPVFRLFIHSRSLRTGDDTRISCPMAVSDAERRMRKD